jgi:heptosyltransferase-1
VKRLLIVKLSSLGDVLHALPVVKSIKQELPDLFVGWVVRERCAGLVKGSEFVDKVYVIPNKPSILDLLDLSKDLRAGRYDTAFDMQGLFLSGLIALLSGASKRVGLNRNREMNVLFLSDANIEGKLPLTHAVDVQLGFRKAAGLVASTSIPVLDHLGQESRSWIDGLEEAFGSQRVVLLNVGASTVFKRWPNESWIEVGKALVIQGYHLILTAGQTETHDSEIIERGIDAGKAVSNLGGKTTMDQLAAILKRADLVISGDTGPMHLAASVGTPTIALFGPTDPRLTGPYGSKHSIIWKQLSCSPCFRHPTCNGRVDCLKSITVEDVLAEVRRHLSVPAGSGKI